MSTPIVITPLTAPDIAEALELWAATEGVALRDDLLLMSRNLDDDPNA
ncbi:MAG TPA: hypothetical protein VFJ16_02310 [Longimicrobium sp.]|nr:hypothetical protein [Longimicrobium sp.]